MADITVTLVTPGLEPKDMIVYYIIIITHYSKAALDIVCCTLEGSSRPNSRQLDGVMKAVLSAASRQLQGRFRAA